MSIDLRCPSGGRSFVSRSDLSLEAAFSNESARKERSVLHPASFSLFTPDPPTPRAVFDNPAIIERVSPSRAVGTSAAALAKRVVRGWRADSRPSGVLQDVGASGE